MHKPLLTKGNSELRADGIYTWSIPALGVKLSNGKNFLTCPSAGVCANLCYARNGTYMFAGTRAAHLRNLELSLNVPEVIKRMTIDLQRKAFLPAGKIARYAELLDGKLLTPWQQDWLLSGGKAVRIHDSGDFYNYEYFNSWVSLANTNKHVFFYAYTKEVAMIKAHGNLPENVVIIFSMGGKQDALIDKNVDRHSDVFPTVEYMTQAKYTDNERSDILAALLPTNRIGLLANNIPSFRKKQGNQTFSDMQTNKI